MDAELLRDDARSRDAGRLILEGADLIDGTGSRPLSDSMVVIEGDRIRYAGARTSRFDGIPAKRLSVAGKTLIPGLIEAHTHAHFDADMFAYVKNGITTVRFAGLAQHDVVRLKGRIASGEIPGPRILSCGPMIDEDPPAYPEWSVAVSSPKNAAEATERLIKEYGVDFVIVTQRVTAPNMEAVIKAAHANGRTVLGQTWEVDGGQAAKLGIDELHNSARVFVSRDYPAERLLDYGTIADRLALSGRGWATIDWDATKRIMDAMIEAGTCYCGMQVITQFQLGEGVPDLEADADFNALFGETERTSFLNFIDLLQSTWSEEDFAHWRIANDNRMEWMARFLAMGGVLLTGTDMQFGGIMLHREIRNLERLGLTPMEVITAATSGNARALRRGDSLGMIQAGKLADIVVLNRSPQNDLGALRDVRLVIGSGAILWGDTH